MGGALELTAGVLTSEVGLGVPMAMDGGTRILGNIAKMVGYANGGKKAGDAAPTNLGQMIGQIADNNNDPTKVGPYQTELGISNDAISILAPNPDKGPTALIFINNLFNAYWGPGTIVNTYMPDYNSLNNLSSH